VDAKYLTVDHIPLKDILRIFQKIHIDPLIQWNGTPCWTWIGMIFKRSGYGRVGWGYRHTECSHRVMYAWLVAPIPYRVSGQKTPQLDHLCRNKLCCNPVHLELVSPRVNSVKRGTGLPAQNAQKTHCHKGHEFTLENTIWDTPSHRSCRICRQTKAAKAKQAPDYNRKMAKYQKNYRDRLDRVTLRAKWRAYYHAHKQLKLS